MTAQSPDFTAEAGGHAVHFYDEDAELTGLIRSFFSPALEAGGTAIMIATKEHRHAVESGLGPGLVLLDAEATLAMITRDGRIHPELFDRVIGGLVRDALTAGGPVHAYGEMVGVLWDAGQVMAALELEKLWNELQVALPFSLLCAYRRSSVSDPEQADAVQQVCQLHSHVLNAPIQRTREFPAEPAAPATARRFVADVLRSWGHADAVIQEAQLVISELATNAVIHASSPFSVRISGEDSGVRISVTDRSPASPQLKAPSESEPTGRGLQVVSALASRWGVDTLEVGKSVWAQLQS
jgi:anti-sigma regulatory factor (Ser/Thr protein kinase)